MSGGSLDYVYVQVQEAAETIRRRAETPLHRAFGKHLEKVSAALYALEWVFSGDTNIGSEAAAIQACLSKGAELEQCVEDARRALGELEIALAKVQEK